MEHHNDSLRVVSRLANALADTGSPFTARLRRSLTLVREELGAAGSVLYLLSSGREWRVLGEDGFLTGNESGERGSLEPVVDHVLSSRAPLQVADVLKDPKFREACPEVEAEHRALVASPLWPGQTDTPVGALLATRSEAFAPPDLDRLALLAQWIAPFIADCLRSPENPLNSPETATSPTEKESLGVNGANHLEDLEFVIHDLKSPLAALMTNLDLLHGISQTEKQASLTRTALTSAHKLYQRITQFLELSRLESLSYRNREWQAIDLERTVAQQQREHQSQLDAKQLRLLIDGPGGTMVLAKESLLHHLLQNLIANAIRHTPNGGRITISWSAHEAKRKEDPSPGIISFCIEDTGEGIPEEKKQELMRSIQLGYRTYVGERGSGLGLIICSRIIGILQGNMWIEDASPQGTRVCFTLPCALDGSAKVRTRTPDPRQQE
jgi:signal transduction histidine kinase